MPLAATLVSERIYEGFYSEDINKSILPRSHDDRNPSACAAGLASLELYERKTAYRMLSAWKKS